MSYASHLPALLWKPVIQTALFEDLGREEILPHKHWQRRGRKYAQYFAHAIRVLLRGLKGPGRLLRF